MSKTITIKDVVANPEAAKRFVESQARDKARYYVMQAKKRLGNRIVAYVDGRMHDAGVEVRTDLVKED